MCCNWDLLDSTAHCLFTHWLERREANHARLFRNVIMMIMIDLDWTCNFMEFKMWNAQNSSSYLMVESCFYRACLARNTSAEAYPIILRYHWLVYEVWVKKDSVDQALQERSCQMPIGTWKSCMNLCPSSIFNWQRTWLASVGTFYVWQVLYNHLPHVGRPLL